MSAKKSSSSSNTTSNLNTTTTPTNPDWVTNGVQGLMGDITGLNGSSIPGASELQQQAFDQGSNLTSGDDRYAGAMAAANGIPSVEAQSLLTGLQDYMSPYTQDVVNTTLADFDANAGVTRAAQAAQGARGQAFGGSRWGVQEAATEGQLARARATADATLRDQGFSVGAGLSGQDADRRQSASVANQQGAISKAGLLASIAGGSQAADAQNLGLLSGLGDTQHALDVAQSPLGVLGAKTGLLGQLPLNLFTGSNTTGTTTGTAKGKSTQIGGQIGWNAQNGFSIGG